MRYNPEDDRNQTRDCTKVPPAMTARTGPVRSAILVTGLTHSFEDPEDEGCPDEHRDDSDGKISEVHSRIRRRQPRKRRILVDCRKQVEIFVNSPKN